MMVQRFFVFCLPRSRSAWLANLLSTESVMCLHEALIGCASPSDMETQLLATGMPIAGSADTGIMMLVEDIVELYPDARFVVLCRDLTKFPEQMARMKVAPKQTIQMLKSFNHASDYLSALGDQTIFVNSTDLDDYPACQRIWEHIGMATTLNPMRWAMLRDMKVETIMSRMEERVSEHIEAVKALGLYVDEE